MKSIENANDKQMFGSEYPALANKNKKYGDILLDNKGRKYRVEEPDTKGLKTWGKDHILVREIDDEGKEVYDYGSYGWFPANLLK